MTPATDGSRHVGNRLNSLSQPIVVNAPDPSTTPRRVGVRAAMISLVALGIGLRFIALVSDRCLWIDEAMLALNLLDRTPRQLLEPLDWNQGAPAGFLVLTKMSLLLFGTAEWAFRLVAFLGSAIGLFAFAWVARRLLAIEAAVMATALFAISPYLISYAGECKQYATDAALAVAMYCAAIGLLHGKQGLRRWTVLASAGALAVWFSHPVAFVLGGIGAALFLEAMVMKDRRRALACLATIACWLSSFGLCYVVCLRHLENNQYLLDYWAGHFLPLLPTSQADLLWLIDHFFSLLAYPGGLAGTEVKAGGIAAALCLVGLVAIAREHWSVAVALLLPALLALLASGVQKYPFAGRLLLFLVPFMLLAVARGAWSVFSALRPSQPFAAIALLGLLFLAPAVETYQSLRRPPRDEQIVPILDAVRAGWKPGDKVYVYYSAVPAFTFYTREHAFPPGVIFGKEHREARTGYRDELAKLVGQPRIWIIFSHPHQSDELLLRAYAEGFGECKGEIQQPGSAAFLYDFRVKP